MSKTADTTIPLEAGFCYHIFNRGNNKQTTFYKEKKYGDAMDGYLDTFAYCLLPNHFHLLVRVKDLATILEKAKVHYPLISEKTWQQWNIEVPNFEFPRKEKIALKTILQMKLPPEMPKKPTMQKYIIKICLLISVLAGLSNCQHLKQKEATLIQAYLATDYQVYSTPTKTLHIRINQVNKATDRFLKNHQSWAYVTAWNPNSKVLPAIENERRNKALEKELQEKKFLYYLGKGVPDKGDWIPEVSFLVVDLSKGAAIKMGQSYGQKAIVWGKVGGKATLIFCN